MGLTTSEMESDFFLDVKDTKEYEIKLIADLQNGLFEQPKEIILPPGESMRMNTCPPFCY